MLTVIREFIEKLYTAKVRYCHWKSNMALPQALSGATDIDLLVHRKDADLFRTTVNQVGFRPTVMKDGISFPSVEHYFALDEETGVLVHLHAYYRVVTGESLAKNFRLPLEEMLLANTREISSVPVPTKSAELIIFTLRMMLKHTSFMELLLLAKDWKQVTREIVWLLEADSSAQAVRLVEDFLPSIDPGLFSDCLASLQSRAPVFRRILLGNRLRSSLRIYARNSLFWSLLDGAQKFAILAFRRLTRSQKGMIPQSGGAVIAFVGPEATGKSTLLAEIRNWLGEHFAVAQIHVGKPRSTLLTMLPNLLVPALRFILPAQRSNRVTTQQTSDVWKSKPQETYPLMFAIRSVLLAYDRRALLTRAFSQASNGSIILCDRYPSSTNGAPDSPQLSQFPIARDRHPIIYRLAQIEKRLYREIPSPDLVIFLSVPVEVAIFRNNNRGKKEPEDYVRLRHAQSSNLEFEKAHVYKVNTDQPLDRTVLEVKKAIWKAL